MDFSFKVLKPEEEIFHVSGPQILIYETSNGGKNVVVYFMANSALEIIEGHAVSSFGKVKLSYSATSANDALTASVSLKKVIFSFPKSQGMANQIEFNGQKT